jgi:hypothetical protein
MRVHVGRSTASSQGKRTEAENQRRGGRENLGQILITQGEHERRQRAECQGGGKLERGSPG